MILSYLDFHAVYCAFSRRTPEAAVPAVTMKPLSNRIRVTAQLVEAESDKRTGKFRVSSGN